MEFLTAKQKKQKARRLYVGYVLLSILVMLATYVLISTALGFEVISTKGNVVQNGLVFIDSRPSNAEVYLNGKKESNNTNAKYSIPESTYDITLKKQGYRDWNGSVALIGGTVEFMTYPRLMPVVPATFASLAVSSPLEQSQSRDNRWVANYSASVPNNIMLVDLENPDESPKNVTIPPLLTGEKQLTSINFVEWAGDNEHFLFSYTLTGSTDSMFAVMSRNNPDDVVNLSTMFSLASSDKLGFWNAKRDQIYVHRDSGAVFIANSKDKSLSAQSLVADTVVEFFAISDERALYTTKTGDELQIKYFHKDKIYSITTAKDPSKPVIAKSFGFNRNDYILLAGEGLEKTLLYRNFENAASESTSGKVAPYYIFPGKSTTAEASRSNRFVLASDGQTSAVYDIEQRDLHRYELPVTRPADIDWFDDARLYAVGSDNKLSIFDFDGKNVYELSPNVEGIPFVNNGVSTVMYVTSKDAVTTMQLVDIESASK